MRRLVCLAVGMVFLMGGFSITKGAEKKPPETIVIKRLENLYGEVEFPHSDHFDYVDDCSVCHHHSGKKTVSCVNCHKPFEVYKYEGSKRKTGLGLKGAYHGRCLRCHMEEESGPVGCTDCHEIRRKPVPNFEVKREEKAPETEKKHKK